MKPKAFLQQLKNGRPASGYLFAGNEMFYRDRCRRTLRRAVLGAADSSPDQDGWVEYDLREHPLSKLIDEARTYSLFAPSRVVVGLNAEAALPKRIGSAGGRAADADPLRAYFADPTPGVTLLLEATRYDWSDRDDKAKLERVAKFYSAIPESVEFHSFTAGEALAASRTLARRLELDIGGELLTELVEMLGSDMGRLANDLEKLALYAGTDRAVTAADIEALIPEARHSGVFEFSDALARKDRPRALEILDTLAKSGEYWPMQITLLARLFRQTLAAKEGGTRTANDVMRLFGRSQIPVWPARAKQIVAVAAQFSIEELERALIALFEADRDLRSERPSDRLIIEQLVVGLTA